MTDHQGQLRVSRELSRHILPTSATMIGICTTFIGLVKLAEARIGPSHVDEYAALAALLFLDQLGGVLFVDPLFRSRNSWALDARSWPISSFWWDFSALQSSQCCLPTRRSSGVLDLTFATHQAASSSSECQIQNSTKAYVF